MCEKIKTDTPSVSFVFAIASALIYPWADEMANTKEEAAPFVELKQR
jgi:hypothetical protein